MATFTLLGARVQSSNHKQPVAASAKADRLIRRRLVTLICAAAACVVAAAGCAATGWDRSGDETGTGSSDPRSSEAFKPSFLPPSTGSSGENTSSLRQRPIIVLQINFDVLRVRAARGVFSESGKIWNHVDEEAIPADTAVLLQRNGLRVARGNESAWPAIKALLESEPEVETVHDAMVVRNGLPLEVELDPRPRDQTLFLFRRNGHLAGQPYLESTNFLRIEYGIPVTAANAVVVEVMPEIRLPLTPPRPKLSRSGWIEHPSGQPTRVLRELAFRLEVGPAEFVAIGPSTVARQGHLAGSLLLCEEVDGRPFESLYFITPRVVRTGSPRAP